jgi:hypothetical protein
LEGVTLGENGREVVVLLFCSGVFSVGIPIGYEVLGDAILGKCERCGVADLIQAVGKVFYCGVQAWSDP